MAKYGIYQKIFCEIDLFDFTSFFGLDFFKFSGPLWVYYLGRHIGPLWSEFLAFWQIEILSCWAKNSRYLKEKSKYLVTLELLKILLISFVVGFSYYKNYLPGQATIYMRSLIFRKKCLKQKCMCLKNHKGETWIERVARRILEGPRSHWLFWNERI